MITDIVEVCVVIQAVVYTCIRWLVGNARGLAYGGLNQYEMALQEFEASIRLAPNNAWIYYNRALTYERMAQHDKALADLKVALSRTNPPLNRKKREDAIAVLGSYEGINV